MTRNREIPDGWPASKSSKREQLNRLQRKRRTDAANRSLKPSDSGEADAPNVANATPSKKADAPNIANAALLPTENSTLRGTRTPNKEPELLASLTFNLPYLVGHYCVSLSPEGNCWR